MSDVSVSRAPDLALSGTTDAWSRQKLISWLLVPLIVEILSWQGMQLVGNALLDSSWQAALEMALHFHLAFGPQVIFTYGPLGFLTLGDGASTISVWYGSL